MITESSRSHVYAPKYRPDPISDEDLIRGYLLSLGASGRRPKTLETYGDSIRSLSDYAREHGLSNLATMGVQDVRQCA